MMELSGTTVYDKKTLRAFSFFALCPIKKAGRWNILLFVFSFAMGIIGFYLENTLEARLSAFLSNRLFVLSALFVIYPVMIVIFLLAVTWKKKQPFTIHFVFRDEAFHVEFSAKDSAGAVDFDDSAIVKCYELKKFFYLYAAKDKVYILQKDAFDAENGAVLLREKLKTKLGNRYFKFC
ncbi:MAG: hypothetical protein KH382_06770 [Clostridiales bacterium]|nr:hypothetical protein [Clostridiales bacterium]